MLPGVSTCAWEMCLRRADRGHIETLDLLGETGRDRTLRS